MIAAVVPVKRFRDAKSRLAPELSEPDRADLALRLARHVVAALRASATVDRIAVVSSERGLEDLLQTDVLADRGSLNASLETGVQWALHLGARSLLIVPADLPLLQSADLQALFESSSLATAVTIAPTGDGGTGALLLSPPGVISPAFGRQSFQRHVDLARRRGIIPEIVRREGFTHDLDTIEDFQAVRARLDLTQ